MNGHWLAETIISTIPWTLWPQFCAVPDGILHAIGALKNASIDVDYHPDTLDSDSHWTYEPDERLAHHRLLLRSKFRAWLPRLLDGNKCRALGAYRRVRFHNEFAYPVNTIGKPEAIATILAWVENHRVIGLGRWGRWEHMNSDIAVQQAMQKAAALARAKAPA